MNCLIKFIDFPGLIGYLTGDHFNNIHKHRFMPIHLRYILCSFLISAIDKIQCDNILGHNILRSYV